MERPCCNSFGMDNCIHRVGQQPLAVGTAAEMEELTNTPFEAVDQMCVMCRKELTDSQTMQVDESEDDDFGNDPHIIEATVRENDSLSSAEESPLRLSPMARRDAEEFLESIVKRARINIPDPTPAPVVEEEVIEVSDGEIPENCYKCKDLDGLIEDLKEKFTKSNHGTQLQILTLAPSSWTVEETAVQFKTSPRMVKQARKLKLMAGILAVPQKRKSKKLRRDIKKKVLKFYGNEEFTWACPGRRDFIYIRVNGRRMHKQKRLLMCNLREMYVAYVNSHGNSIGFSKFCELKPKWCVTMGARGAHAVSVCASHQNAKLMLSVTPIRGTYKALIEKTVCDIESQQCMLRRCDVCPGKKHLKSYLAGSFTQSSDDDIVEFKQWIQTDKSTLCTRNATVEDFIEEFTQKICNLKTHHFISKNQSRYLRNLKGSKVTKEIIILMDFSENYSFLVQDASHTIHWNRMQATIYPIVIYIPGPSPQCLSMCIISDSLIHDPVAVYAFQSKLIEHLKVVLGQVSAIHYFSDGSTSIFKNYKNFINLCFHEEDFGIAAEWNFFATGHGRADCDEIGGTVKRLATRASLQRPVTDQIETPRDLFHFCDSNILGTKFFFVSREEIQGLQRYQERRFSLMGHSLPAIRNYHQVRPTGTGEIQISKFSGDDTSEIIKLF